MKITLILICLSFLFGIPPIRTNINNIDIDSYSVLYEKSDGKYTGNYTSYYQSTGNIRAKGTLLNGKHTGSWIVNDSLGNLLIKRVYTSQNDFKQTFPLSKVTNSAELKEGTLNSMWTKRLWRHIPKENNEIIFDGYLLAGSLLKLASNNQIKTYSPLDEELTTSIGYDSLYYVYKEVIAFKLKEDNFYNPNTLRMETKIIGICPIVEVNKKQVDLAWFYFPEFINQLRANNTLSHQKVLNIFEARNFYSFITKESNRNNLTLSEYTLKNNQTLSDLRERIEINLIEKEHDFWIDQVK